MPERKKSAKDLAFDKERASFRKRIRELEREVKVKNDKIHELEIQLSEKEVELVSKQDWINRLLEYMDLSEEDFTRLMDNEKIKSELYNQLGNLGKLFGMYGL